MTLIRPAERLAADVTANTASIVGEVLPQLLLGLTFLLIAGLGVKLGLSVVRRGLRKAFPAEGDLAHRRVIYSLIAIFLWFGVTLTFLSIVGLDDLAAALGTATGFLALGVSYALKDLVADAVAGLYLIRDSDFNPGDTVVVDGFTGRIESIELRNTRFHVEGDVVVRANGKIDGKWTKCGEETAE